MTTKMKIVSNADKFEYIVHITPVLEDAMAKVTIYQPTPNRKIFKKRYIGTRTFWLMDYESIAEGVQAMVDKETTPSSEQLKWAKFYKDNTEG